MTNLNPISNPVRSNSNLNENPPINRTDSLVRGAENVNVPRPTSPSTEGAAQPLEQHQIVPAHANRRRNYFRYYLAPFLGLLTTQEATRAESVESNITRLEGIFNSHSEVISNRIPIDRAVNQIRQANELAGQLIQQLENERDQIGELASNYARYSKIPEKIEALKIKKRELEAQQQIGEVLSRYNGALQDYNRAVETNGIANSWDAFVQTRSALQDVTNSLLTIIRNNPNLNNNRKIQALVANIEGSESKAIPIIKLIRYVYPQYEKQLLKLFNGTVRISRQRIADLKRRGNHLKSSLDRYRTQTQEVNRLIALRDDQGLLSGYARTFHQYRYGETVDVTLARVQQSLAPIQAEIDASRIINVEEIQWLRTLSQISEEARRAYENLSPLITDTYRILTMSGENYEARREALARDLNSLLIQLASPVPNGSQVGYNLSSAIENIDTFRRAAGVVALPVNYDRLPNLKKFEVLVKTYFPSLETEAANLLLLVRRKRLTEDFNETINHISERIFREEADRAIPEPAEILVGEPDDVEPAAVEAVEGGMPVEYLEGELVEEEIRRGEQLPPRLEDLADEDQVGSISSPERIQEIPAVYAATLDPVDALLLDPALSLSPVVEFAPPPAPPLPEASLRANLPPSHPSVTPARSPAVHPSASDLQARASSLRKTSSLKSSTGPFSGILGSMDQNISKAATIGRFEEGDDEESIAGSWNDDEDEFQEKMVADIRAEKAREEDRKAIEVARRREAEAARRAAEEASRAEKELVDPSTSPLKESNTSKTSQKPQMSFTEHMKQRRARVREANKEIHEQWEDEETSKKS